MAQFNFDLSQYQGSEYERYSSQWKGCADLSPAFFDNSVSYSSEGRTLHIRVCTAYEFETMFELYDELGHPYPVGYQKEPAVEEVECWRNDLQKIREKFGAAFQVQPPNPLYPHDVSERKINAFSGTEITVPLGEGLLNFCYADFNTAFEHCVPAYLELAQKNDATAMIHSAEEGGIHLYKLYAEGQWWREPAGRLSEILQAVLRQGEGGKSQGGKIQAVEVCGCPEAG